jgi:choline dehydrogenase-like flavoprotein
VLIDARSLPSNHTLETDVCIVGGGAAGIALALEFAGRPFRVLLLESGGFEPDAEIQALCDGTSVGLPYFPLVTARLRQFGGSTNHWSGVCWPFTEEDFEARPWIPYSGWPLTKDAVDPFYRRALALVQLRHDRWTPEFWSAPDTPLLPFADDRVVSRVNQRAWPEGRRLRFGHAYRDRVVQAGNITTCLHGSGLRLETNESGQVVTRLRATSLAGNRFSVTARSFVLAAGGIENPRLLLVSAAGTSAGLGNQHGLVGRFFLEHPRCLAGILRPANPRLPIRFYEYRRLKDSLVSATLELSEALRRAERLVHVTLALDGVHDEIYTQAWASAGVASLNHLLARLRRGSMPEDLGRHLGNVAADLDDLALSVYAKLRFGEDYPLDHLKLVATIDPVPNPESRVTLGPDLDRLGQRRVKLDWRLSPLDKYSLRRTMEILALEVGRAKLGRLQITLDDSDTSWPADLVGAWHHMGTTRMSDDPRRGVVDRHCRVHGLSNLFIAGSSVFPTAGAGTPTFLLLALALRLADQIKEQFR